MRVHLLDQFGDAIEDGLWTFSDQGVWIDALRDDETLGEVGVADVAIEHFANDSRNGSGGVVTESEEAELAFALGGERIQFADQFFE